MASGLKVPAFADFSDNDLADFIARMQLGSQAPDGPGPVQSIRGAGEVDPTGRGYGSVDQRRPPQFAANEDQAQALERQMASPADRAALGAPQGSADALLFDRAGMGGGLNPFGAAPGAADPYGVRNVPLPPGRPSDADLMMPAPAPVATGSVSGMNPGPIVGGAPQRPALATPAAPQAAAPVPPPAFPANDFDPLTGQIVAGSPQPLGAISGAGGRGTPLAPGAAPGVAAPGAPQQSMLEKFAAGLNNPAVSDLLLNMGIGLMSQRGFGPGLAAGLQGYQSSQAGQTRQLLEQFKLQQQIAGQQAQRNYLIKTKGLSPDAADALIANPALLSNQLAMEKPNYQTVGGNIYDMNKNNGVPGPANLIGPASGPPSGYRQSADGGLDYIPRGPEDPQTKERNALATAPDKTQTPLTDIEARRRAGIPDSDTRTAWSDPFGKVTFNDGPPLIQGRPGQTVYERGTLKPVLTVPPAKPESFDTESKLRAEFAKGLGSFNDVHDGYGRVIAATKQRQDNPGAKSPASDIGLIFGFMKMLDPGSVVREGEYATAKNAAGVPDRVLNAYNKAIDGEFLSDRQRQDFLGQAEALYGGARKTAEGVVGRYRGLASSYGVDPERSVYLPEMPVAPRIGGAQAQPGQGAQTPAAPSVGAVMRGYRFKGGDPSDSASWERAR